jgi:hypothetical protein
MGPRLAVQIVDARDNSAASLLPREVASRLVRVGVVGDVELPLPGEIMISERCGRVYVASARHEVPVAFLGCRLPAWPVPVPVPCVLDVGGAAVRLFWSSAPPPAVARHAPHARHAPRPYLADRILLAVAARASRASRAIAKEWRASRVETKLALAAVLLAALVAGR